MINIVLIIIYICLILLDTYLTAKLFTIDRECEANPILRWIYDNSSITGVVISKLIFGFWFIPFVTDIWVYIVLDILYIGVAIHNIRWFREYNMVNGKSTNTWNTS